MDNKAATLTRCEIFTLNSLLCTESEIRAVSYRLQRNLCASMRRAQILGYSLRLVGLGIGCNFIIDNQWQPTNRLSIIIYSSHFFSNWVLGRRLFDLLVPGSFPDQFYRVGREVIKNKVDFINTHKS